MTDLAYMDEKYVGRRYTHPRFPGAFSGLQGFLKNNNYQDRRSVEQALLKLDSYVSHKPTRRKYLRRPMICPEIDSVWSIDLADMQKLKTRNKNFSFILVAVDCLSKTVFTRALKNKSQIETRNALEDIFRIHKRKPRAIFSDQGTEFMNKEVKALLRRKGIKLYHSFSSMKAFQAERAIRTLKSKLYRYMTHNKNSEWVSSLKEITMNINSSFNKSIGMPSDKVTKSNVSEVWHKLYDRVVRTKKVKPKFAVGDKVRVSISSQ
jgi:transposase InsO family protein